MSLALKIVTPFTPVLSRWMSIILVVQAVIAIAAWTLAGSTVLPSPLEVVKAWSDLVQKQDLLFELWASVKVNLLALIISSVAAITVAALSTAAIFQPMARFWSSLRFLGFAGLTYVFMLISSDSYWLRVWLLSFGMFVFLVTSLLAEIKSLPSEQVDHCRTLGMSGWRITYELVLLGKSDVTLDLIRQNAAVGWTLLTLVEGMTRNEGGIGALLLNQNRYFLLAGVFAIQITILVYGLGQDVFLGYLKTVVCPHARLGKNGASK